ncbi:MAG: FHA domain-containing protein [Gammaproteobacteria bacterium]|nr:FHA domain-containing protein [Gammaproteobacteria bacterium]
MSAQIKPGELTPAAQEAPLRVAALTAAAAYLNRCLRAQRPFAVLTGSMQATLAALLDRLAEDCRCRDDLHLVRINAPGDSIQDFLSRALTQLGFELQAAELDDLHNLLVVFLRHEGARGRRTLSFIEHTERCGPRVLEFLQVLSRVRVAAIPAATFMLAGTQSLSRILDSPGMAGLRQFTRERFDLDAAVVRVADVGFTVIRNPPAAMPTRQPANPGRPRTLLVMLDGAIVERRTLSRGRLLIGRGRHNDLCLQSRFVSRNHAVLIVTDREIHVVDLRSTNPTRVNGQPVQNRALAAGDLLSIGNYQLRFDPGN